MARTPEALRAEARALLALRTRGEIRRAAVALARDEALRRVILQLGNESGADLPDDALDWPAAKLLRRARAREAQSQVRKNPIHRDEAFVCAHCAREVPARGTTARDHCPHCLRSLHVDVVPGDRQASCGGIMDPVGGLLVGGQVVLHYRCRACGAAHQVRAATDGTVPDDWNAVVKVTAGESP